MQKVILLLVVCVALTQAQDILKFVPANVLQGVSKVKAAVEDIIKPEAGPKDVQDVKGVNKPKFCNGLDCPPFEVKEKTEEYELREYAASHWVTTALTGIEYKPAQYQMFMKLFRYISGNNADQKKIAMTCPVIVRIIPGQGPACESNFTMSFYVSPSEGTPSAPSDPTVSISKLPALQAYAAEFSGFANEEKYIEHATALGKALDKAGKKFEKAYFYTAGYDAPFKLFNRHNEVWMLA